MSLLRAGSGVSVLSFLIVTGSTSQERGARSGLLTVRKMLKTISTGIYIAPKKGNFMVMVPWLVSYAERGTGRVVN